MWVGATALAEVLPQSRQGKVLSVASPSGVGLEEGASVASSMAIKLAHVVSLSDVFVVVALAIGIGFVVLALRLLTYALRSLVLVASEATLRPSSLVLFADK